MPRPTRDLVGAEFGEPWPAPGGSKRAGYTWKVSVRYADGSRSVLSRKGATSDEARDSLQAAMTGKQAPKPGITTMRELARIWELAQRNPRTSAVSEQTMLTYLSTWRLHIEPSFGERDITTITHDEIFAFVHSEERTIRPKSLVDVLRAFYRFAVNRGVTATNPALGGFEIRAPAQTPKPIDAATMLKVERHLAALPARGRRTDTLLLLHTWQTMRGAAARIGEVLGLRVRDWDPSTRRLRVGEVHIGKVESKTKPGSTTYGPIDGAKTDAGRRTVTVAADVATVLDARCADRKPDDWVFRSDRGTYLSPENLRSRLRRELVKLELDGQITPHDLRDTSASVLAQELTRVHGLADGLRAAAAQLGHAGVGRALRAYVDPSAIVEDHSTILAQTNPLLPIAQQAMGILRRVEDATRMPVGGFELAGTHVRIGVGVDHVDLARAELAELGDLVVVEGVPGLKYDRDEVF